MTFAKYALPRIFIGSSVEGKEIAEAVQNNLEYDADCTLWVHGFGASGTTIESLIIDGTGNDFGIFIFTNDDLIKIRDEEYAITRDNVIFETGLFMGMHGRDRVFIVQPRGVDHFHIASDLHGFTTVNYNAARVKKDSDQNAAALTTAASSIRSALRRSKWFTLRPKIAVNGTLAAVTDNATYPLKLNFKIENSCIYPMLIHSIEFEFKNNNLRIHPKAERFYKPLLFSGQLKVNGKHEDQYADQVAVNGGARVLSCWVPLDTAIDLAVLEKAILEGNVGEWKIRCTWMEEHPTTCVYTLKI
jgi:hypothetical protein